MVNLKTVWKMLDITAIVMQSCMWSMLYHWNTNLKTQTRGW